MTLASDDPRHGTTNGYDYRRYRARTAGHITDRAAGQLAAAYGMHPAEIWGDTWWEAA